MIRLLLTCLFIFPQLALAADAAITAPVWSYDDDETGQEDWGAIDPQYAACEIGTAQSPIDIGTTTPSALPPLIAHYADTKAKTARTNKSFEIRLQAAGNILRVGKKRYTLQRIVLHTPGEHTVQGNFYPVEIQLVHKNAQGETLIVSVFADSGEALPALDPALTGGDFSIDPTSFLPQKPGYYAYTGSITTPPCTEGIEWRIFKHPISISQSQLQSLGKLVGRNARLPQPVYMRVIKESR